MSASGTPDTKELKKILDAMLLTVSWQEQLVYQALDTIKASPGPGCGDSPGLGKARNKRGRK